MAWVEGDRDVDAQLDAEDRALLLRRHAYGESSLVVHALGPQSGRLELLARGGEGELLGARGVPGQVGEPLEVVDQRRVLGVHRRHAPQPLQLALGHILRLARKVGGAEGDGVGAWPVVLWTLWTAMDCLGRAWQRANTLYTILSVLVFGSAILPSHVLRWVSSTVLTC